jgi:hypothetical protein
MDAWAARRLRTFEDADRGLCFGRLDFETIDRSLYVGRRFVHDEAQKQLVVNWQAPAARPFYTATPQDPHGLTLRRRFRSEGRRLLDIADGTLDGTVVDSCRCRRLPARRAGARSRRACATSSRRSGDQYRLITRPDRVLVIQGGRAPPRRQSAASSVMARVRSASGCGDAACSSLDRTGRSWVRLPCPAGARRGHG